MKTNPYVGNMQKRLFVAKTIKYLKHIIAKITLFTSLKLMVMFFLLQIQETDVTI